MNTEENKLEEIQEIEFWKAKFLSKRNMVVIASILCFILGVIIILVFFKLGILTASK